MHRTATTLVRQLFHTISSNSYDDSHANYDTQWLFIPLKKLAVFSKPIFYSYSVFEKLISAKTCLQWPGHVSKQNFKSTQRELMNQFLSRKSSLTTSNHSQHCPIIISNWDWNIHEITHLCTTTLEMPLLSQLWSLKIQIKKTGSVMMQNFANLEKNMPVRLLWMTPKYHST